MVDASDRRASERMLVGQGTVCTFAGPVRTEVISAARLKDISLEGVGLILTNKVEVGSVLAIVLGSALLGFLQEYRASSAVAKLLAVIRTKVRVLRDGHEVELPHDALVPGDVIVLAAGAAVPADCRILHSTDLFVDESTLTGNVRPSGHCHHATWTSCSRRMRRSTSLLNGTRR